MAKITDANDIANAVRKIKSYASGVGKLPETPSIVVLCICWNIPATDGPIDC